MWVTPFEKLIKVRVKKIRVDENGEKVKDYGFPTGWNKVTKSIYNNEDNFSVLTGKVNDIIVIDLDNKKPGFKGLVWFEENFGELKNINTLVTKSFRNGYHIFFKYNKNIEKFNNYLILSTKNK